jgi:hypothetical protein
VHDSQHAHRPNAASCVYGVNVCYLDGSADCIQVAHVLRARHRSELVYVLHTIRPFCVCMCSASKIAWMRVACSWVVSTECSRADSRADLDATGAAVNGCQRDRIEEHHRTPGTHAAAAHVCVVRALRSASGTLHVRCMYVHVSVRMYVNAHLVVIAVCTCTMTQPCGRQRCPKCRGATAARRM